MKVKENENHHLHARRIQCSFPVFHHMQFASWENTTIKPLGEESSSSDGPTTRNCFYPRTYVSEIVSLCVCVCVLYKAQISGALAKSLCGRRLKSSWETFMSSERIFVLVFHVLLWILRRRLRELISNFIARICTHTYFLRCMCV